MTVPGPAPASAPSKSWALATVTVAAGQVNSAIGAAGTVPLGTATGGTVTVGTSSTLKSLASALGCVLLVAGSVDSSSTLSVGCGALCDAVGAGGATTATVRGSLAAPM